MTISPDLANDEVTAREAAIDAGNGVNYWRGDEAFVGALITNAADYSRQNRARFCPLGYAGAWRASLLV